MATSVAIEMAARGPSKHSPTPLGNADALLNLGRRDGDAEARELAKARRVVVRMALGRHACRALGGESCAHLLHVEHQQDALASLRVLGLADVEMGPRRQCQGCKRRVPAADVADRGDGEPRCPACRERQPAVPPVSDELKRCSRCKVAKPLREFHRNPKGAAELHSRCKSCRAAEERRRVRDRSRAAR